MQRQDEAGFIKFSKVSLICGFKYGGNFSEFRNLRAIAPKIYRWIEAEPSRQCKILRRLSPYGGSHSG